MKTIERFHVHAPGPLERARTQLGNVALASLGALGAGAAALALGLIPPGWRVAAQPLVVVAVASATLGEALRFAGATRRSAPLPWLRASGALVAATFILWQAASHLWPDVIDLTASINEYLIGAVTILAGGAVVDAWRGSARKALPPFAIAGVLTGAVGLLGVATLVAAEDRLSMSAWRWGFIGAMVCLGIAGWVYVRLRRGETGSSPNDR